MGKALNTKVPWPPRSTKKKRVAVVRAGGVDAVLIGDNLPELGADLVAALAGLDVNELAHLVGG